MQEREASDLKTLPLLVLVGVAVLVMAACGGGQAPLPPPQSPPPWPPPCAPAPAGTIGVNLEDPGGSGPYMFDPSELTFDVGDTVTFTLCAETEFHTFTVDDLGIFVDVNGGTSETLTFTFDQPGTFRLICIPHQVLGMTGTITVGPTPPTQTPMVHEHSYPLTQERSKEAPMAYTVWTYVVYLAVSVTVALWVGWSLHRHGRTFLVQIFQGNEDLADSVNHLLIVGFYLVSIGFVTVALQYGAESHDIDGAIKSVSTKVGVVLFVLGGLHFVNMFIFSRLRWRVRLVAPQEHGTRAAGSGEEDL